MPEETRQGLTRSELWVAGGMVVTIAISAIGGLINYGSQRTRIETLQSTVVSLNQSVTTLNQTLQSTREEMATLKAQRDGTEKALADIKSTLDSILKSRY